MFESFLGVNPWTSLFILLNTLTIYFVAKKHLFGPVLQIITERQQEIDRMYESADCAQRQAEALRADYRQKLSTAQQTSQRLVQEAVIRGQHREAEILRKANAEAAAVLDKAEAEIQRERQQAVLDAKGEVSSLALTIAEMVVERELTQTDHAQLIDRFLDRLGDNP